MEFDVVTQADEFYALEADWRSLCDRLDQIRFSQTFDWARHSWELVAKQQGYSLSVVIGKADGRIQLIWPLVTKRFLLWRQARWLGPQASEYTDLLVEGGPDRSQAVAAAVDFAKSHLGVDLLLGEWVRRDAAISQAVGMLPHSVIIRTAAPFMNLTRWESWEDYYASLKSHYRSDHKRLWRRLSEIDTVSLDTVRTNDDFEETLAWMFVQKEAWVDRTQTKSSFVVSEAYQNFLHAVLKDALAADQLQMTVLRLGGKIIGAQMALLAGKCVECFFVAYDREYRKYGPGRLLGEEVIKRSYALGMEVCDYRLGKETYKYTWATGEVDVGKYLWACSLWGQVYVAWRNTKWRRVGLQNLRKRLSSSFSRRTDKVAEAN
ncbi:MAG: GNAT family N-acetyltransferase [Pseudomonadota bacterium]